jgi:hypothetical protein
MIMFDGVQKKKNIVANETKPLDFQVLISCH